MAWIYLAESVDCPWPYRHGSERSFIVNKTDMLRPFCYLGWPNQNCITHRSGMMSGPCVQNSSQKSTSFLEDSPARISALQEMERAWEEVDRAYFSKSSDSLANFDPDSFSWKTSQQSLFGGLTEFCWISLRWGMIVDGRLYQPQKWEPLTFENDGSCFLGTPTGRMSERSEKFAEGRLPTPAEYVRRWPTPQSRDWKDGNNPKPHGRHSDSLPTVVNQLNGGPLNPMWVEWLMGFPLKWTALDAWAMQWFRPKRGKRSKDLRGCNETA